MVGLLCCLSLVAFGLNMSLSHAQPAPGAHRIVFSSDSEGNEEIYTMDPDGSDVLMITDNPARDFAPDWSPDATQIAFISTRSGAPKIYVMDSDGTGLTEIGGVSTPDSTLDWSPDGSKIIMVL